jgi:hypothetical protein
MFAKLFRLAGAEDAFLDRGVRAGCARARLIGCFFDFGCGFRLAPAQIDPRSSHSEMVSLDG